MAEKPITTGPVKMPVKNGAVAPSAMITMPKAPAPSTPAAQTGQGPQAAK